MTLTGNVVYDAAAVLVGFVTILIVYYKWALNYWEKRGLYSPPTLIPFGNSLPLVKKSENIGLFLRRLYLDGKYRGLKHMGFYFLSTPQYLPIDIDIIKNILQADNKYFLNRGQYINEKADPLSAHLFNLEDERWRTLRQKFSPLFTTLQLKNMFRIFHQTAEDLCTFIQKTAETGPIDAKRAAQNYTINVITSAGFGTDSNCFEEPDSLFLKMGDEALTEVASTLVTQLIVPHFILRLINYSASGRQVTKSIINTLHEIFAQREKTKIQRKDIIDLLIKLKTSAIVEGIANGDSKGAVTFEECAAQLYLFFLAGYETSATTLSLSLYELSKNQNVQDKLREDILNTLKKHDGQLTFESVHEMKYLNTVIKETLRMYPPLSFLHRKCSANYKVPGTDLTIEKGTTVIISPMGLHYDPEHHHQPEVFKPERFEDSSAQNKFNYLPFGEGPRNCVGKRFGETQIAVGLALLIKNFKFSLNSRTAAVKEIDPHQITINLIGGIWLNAQKIT